MRTRILDTSIFIKIRTNRVRKTLRKIHQTKISFLSYFFFDTLKTKKNIFYQEFILL